MFATDVSAAEMARSLLALRRRRDADLGADLFGEPAWDMLLELFVADAEGRRLTADELCAATGLPDSAASRWLRTLEVTGRVQLPGQSGAEHGAEVVLDETERRRILRLLKPAA